MKKIFSFVFAIVALANTTYSYSQENTSPNIQQFTDNYLNQFTNTNHISTVAMTLQCLDNQGNLVLKQAYSGKLGFLDNPIENKKTDKDDVFQIGSITKSFTSVVLLQLEEDKSYQFSLDDTVGKWFPADKYPQYQNWKNIKVRQLLNMTSGIPDYLRTSQDFNNQVKAQPFDFSSLEKILNYETAVPLRFIPGTQYDYSNTNYTLAGLLIEKITGNNYRTEVENRIINKLNLKHTTFPKQFENESYPSSKVVHGYNETGPFDVHTDMTNYNMSIYNSAGGIVSNTNDLNIYVKNLYKPGILLNEKQITKLETGEPNIVIEDDDALKVIYGLGIFQMYDKKQKETFYTYQGNTLGFSVFYIYYPNRPVTVSFATNSNSTNSGSNVLNYIYSNVLPQVFGGSTPLCAVQP